MAIVSTDQLDSFRESFGGEALLPSESGYDEARSLWNGDIDRRPAVIARCTTSEQVAAAIAFARAHDLEIAARGGGHTLPVTAAVTTA